MTLSSIMQLTVNVNGLPAACSAQNGNCTYTATQDSTPIIAGICSISAPLVFSM